MLGKLIGWSILAVGVALGTISIIRERRGRRRLLASRQTLSSEIIYGKYYSQSGIDAATILAAWNAIATHLHVDPGKLRPEDTFDSLRPRGLHLQTDLDDLDVYLGIRGNNLGSEVGVPKTVDEAVLRLARRK